jgi:hypothetical protein
LISTSFAIESRGKKAQEYYQLSLFEAESPQFDEAKTRSHGKIFTLTRDKNKTGRADVNHARPNFL